MSDVEKSVDTSLQKGHNFSSIIRDYKLVGGLQISLREPLVGEIFGLTHIEALSKMIIRIKDQDMSKLPEDEIREILDSKNSALTSVFVRKMNEFLAEETKVIRDPLDGQGIIESIFEKNSLERKITFEHEKRKLTVVLSIPATKESISDAMADQHSSKAYLQRIAAYCVKVQDLEKENFGGEWEDVIKSIPYHLSKLMLTEYQNLFEMAEAYLMNDQKMIEAIRNF